MKLKLKLNKELNLVHLVGSIVTFIFSFMGLVMIPTGVMNSQKAVLALGIIFMIPLLVLIVFSFVHYVYANLLNQQGE